MLNHLEKQTIISALRNGLGLTHACSGLHKHPKEVSEDIRTTDNFELECNQALSRGYQEILVSMNDSSNKKLWAKWKDSRSYIDTFIKTLNLWESQGTPDMFSFELVTLSLHYCKTLPETATALGMTEMEFRKKIYTDNKLVHWLIQTGHQI
jgi:hypothetical protein